MKRTLKCMMMLFGLIAVMSFTSCQKDEDLIVGKWECTKVEKECETHIIYHEYNGETWEEECACMENLWVVSEGLIWSFDADGTVLRFLATETWSINEDVLNISDESYVIEELTSSEMILFRKKYCRESGDYFWLRAYFKRK